MSKWQVASLLFECFGVEREVTGMIGGSACRVMGLVQSVQREDGSGRCFNVAMQVRGLPCTVFVKTVD